MDSSVIQTKLELRLFFVKRYNNLFKIFVLFNPQTEAYAVPMSINMSEVGDIMNRDLEITLNEIILDELQQTFLDWYDSAECAIECHFLEFG